MADGDGVERDQVEQDRATAEVLQSSALGPIVATQGLVALLLVPLAWLLVRAGRLLRRRPRPARRG
jgi:hypothetical protein